MTSEPFLRITFTADDDAPFTVMFEPSGMTYEVSGGDSMLADVVDPVGNGLEIVHWKGGVSVWAPGAVITRDAHGGELRRLA